MEEGRVGRGRRWRSLKERLGFKGSLGCCGSSWGFGASDPMAVAEEDEEGGQVLVQTAAADSEEQEEQIGNPSEDNGRDPGCDDGEISPAPASVAMNLATALAAERHFRASGAVGTLDLGEAWAPVMESETPLKVSLMRLLEEDEGAGGGEEETGCGGGGGGGGGVGVSACCCVCMERLRGAAFIPCGHTFCRVCAQELWLNRGSCPLCNRRILDILNLF